MGIYYLEQTGSDALLKGWIAAHFAGDAARGDRIIVDHGSREEATVSPDDLVRRQARLSDGRLIRTDSVSPTRRRPYTVFVTVEAPRSANGESK